MPAKVKTEISRKIISVSGQRFITHAQTSQKVANDVMHDVQYFMRMCAITL